MAHKVHPKAYRLKRLNDWDSRWMVKKNIPQYLEEDFKIREFFNKRAMKLSIEKVEIERFAEKINIIIYSARPGLLIGRGGTGIEDLRKTLEKTVFAGKKKVALKIDIREVKDIWLSSVLVGQWIAQQLEKRMPFRRLMKQALEKVMASKTAQGVRIEISGRLDGSDIARREWLKKGRLPLQTLRADIDYAQVRAMIPQGILGIKVWIYKGEKFE